MPDIYDATALTPLRVARSGGYIDWSAQPSLFKHYPDFLYRIGFDAHPDLKAVSLARCVTSHSTVGGRPYLRLNTPSAGNLHPVELYVQIRGLKGVLSGIYHVDAARGELVLIRECESDGLEPALGLENRFDGFLFLISIVPFRSEWKYGHRAWRYCYMDAGHQIGALCAAMDARKKEVAILNGVETEALNRLMGFDGEEFVCAAVAVGDEGTKSARPFDTPLMRVAPTDYSESDGWLAERIGGSAGTKRFRPCPRTEADASVQLRRRSARGFCDASMEADAFEHILHMLGRMPEGIHAYTLVLRPEHAEQGVYRDGMLCKAGNYAETAVELLVDQRFVAAAEIVMILCAEAYDADLQMAAAAFAHTLSLDAAALGVGYTAIGAFYDRKLQRFLETSACILYVGVFGMERQ